MERKICELGIFCHQTGSTAKQIQADRTSTLCNWTEAQLKGTSPQNHAVIEHLILVIPVRDQEPNSWDSDDTTKNRHRVVT